MLYVKTANFEIFIVNYLHVVVVNIHSHVCIYTPLIVVAFDTCCPANVPQLGPPYPLKQLHMPVLKSHFPRLLQSTWHLLPGWPTVYRSIRCEVIALPSQSVSFTAVRGSSPDGQCLCWQYSPKNSACCVSPAWRPTGQDESHTHICPKSSSQALSRVSLPFLDT